MFGLKLGCFTTIIVIALLIYIALEVSGCAWIDKVKNSGEQELVAPTVVPEGTLLVHFIDVGQGDCTLVDYGDTEVVIDSGKNGAGVVPYLETYTQGSMDAVIATHADADHIGDMDDIFDAFDVDKVVDNTDTKTTQTYLRYVESIEDEPSIIHIQPTRGETFTVGELVFQVLNPEEGSTDDYNENSIVVLLRFGEVNIYLTGDAEEIAEEEMCDAFELPKAHFLKAGHHGSKTSSSQKFLDEILPDNVIYSAGASNSYGHPHQEAIDRWEGCGAFWVGTDEAGTIVLTTDGTVEGSWLDFEKLVVR